MPKPTNNPPVATGTKAAKAKAPTSATAAPAASKPDSTAHWGPRCAAEKKDGSTCKLPAGYQTEHPGHGQCKFHGGKSRVGIEIAARPTLTELTGFEMDISPIDALLMCVRIAAAEVSFFTKKILELSDGEIVGRPRKQAVATMKDDYSIVDLKMPKELNIWVRARHTAMDKLAQYSSMAIKAGVEERRVALAERMGDSLAVFIDAVLSQLKLTPGQRKIAPAVVRQQLLLLEGGGDQLPEPLVVGQ